MEMLSGAGARRVASVVATTRARAAVIPLAAAKQYLSTHTLVSSVWVGWGGVERQQPSRTSAHTTW